MELRQSDLNFVCSRTQQNAMGKEKDMGEMKLFEFSANITCAAVVAAKTEEAAREAIKTWERAWFETGDFQQVNDVDLVDIREIKDSEMDSLHDLAHEVVA